MCSIDGFEDLVPRESSFRSALVGAVCFLASRNSDGSSRIGVDKDDLCIVAQSERHKVKPRKIIEHLKTLMIFSVFAVAGVLLVTAISADWRFS